MYYDLNRRIAQCIMEDFEKFKHIADRVANGFKRYFLNNLPSVMEFADVKQIAYEALLNVIQSPQCRKLNDAQIAAWAKLRIWGAIMNEIEKNIKLEHMNDKDNDGSGLTDGSTPEKEMIMKECLANLNEREKVMVEMLKNGAKQKDIAKHFGVSQPRVCMMIKVMRKKLEKEL